MKLHLPIWIYCVFDKHERVNLMILVVMLLSLLPFVITVYWGTID